MWQNLLIIDRLNFNTKLPLQFQILNFLFFLFSFLVVAATINMRNSVNLNARTILPRNEKCLEIYIQKNWSRINTTNFYYSKYAAILIVLIKAV